MSQLPATLMAGIAQENRIQNESVSRLIVSVHDREGVRLGRLARLLLALELGGDDAAGSR